MQTYIHTKFRPAYSPEKLTQQQTQSYTPPNPPARLSLMNASLLQKQKNDLPTTKHLPADLKSHNYQQGRSCSTSWRICIRRKNETLAVALFFFPGTGIYKYILNHQTHITYSKTSSWCAKKMSMRHVYFGSVLSRPLIIFHDFLNHLAIGSNPAHTDDETNTRSENYESIGAGGTLNERYDKSHTTRR